MGERQEHYWRKPIPTWTYVGWVLGGRKLRVLLMGPRHHVPRRTKSFWAMFFAFYARNRIFRWREIFDEARGMLDGPQALDLRSVWELEFNEELDYQVRKELTRRLTERAKREGRWQPIRETRRREEFDLARQKVREAFFMDAIKAGVCPGCGNTEGGKPGVAPPCHGFENLRLEWDSLVPDSTPR